MLTPRPSDLLALGGFDRIEHLVASESGPPAEAVARALGVRLSRAVGEGRRRAVISGADVVALAGAPEISVGTDVLAYSNDARLEHALAARGARLLGPSGLLHQRLGDKAAMRVAFAAHGLPVPDGFATRAPVRFTHAARRLGVPFIAQARRGSMGRSTWLVRDADSLQAAVAATDARGCLLSRWLSGPTLNLHGLVTPDGVTVSRPSLQLTGPPALTDEPFAYCGADFGAAAAVAPELVAEARAITSRVGELLGDLGWTGIFGADVQLSAEGARLLEVNPRLQASSGLLAEIEAAAGEVPLGRRHAAMLTGVPAGVAAGSCGSSPAPEASFLVLRHRRPGGVVPGWPRSGVYALEHSALVFRRAGVGLRACGPGECWVEGFAAVRHAWHEPGAAMARLAAPVRLVEPDGRSLTADGGALVAGLCRLMGVPVAGANDRVRAALG